MTNYEFQKAAQDRLNEVWAKLHTRTPGRSFPTPNLTFDLRSATCAGQAVGSGKTIRINMGYVSEHAQELLDRTVAHEAGHCWLYAVKDPSHYRDDNVRMADAKAIAWGTQKRRSKRSVHGYAFQELMRFLGVDESRCHQMGKSAFAKAKKTITHKCSACGHIYELSVNISNKIARGQHRYHPKCGFSARIVRVAV